MRGYNPEENNLMLHILDRATAKKIGMTTYFTGKPCKHGHYAERSTKDRICYECKRVNGRKYKAKNKDKIREEGRKYRQNNKEEIANSKKKYQAENRDKIKKYKEDNRPRIRHRARKYSKERYSSDPLYRLALKCRGMVSRVLSHCGGEKSGNTFTELGYTSEQLMIHIESQFLDGMSWDKKGSFHIDHIYPITKFIQDGVTDVAIINALHNLTPMYPEDNLSKNNRTLEEWLDLKGEDSREWQIYSHLLAI